MGEMDSNWCHATSPKAFIVIDDKGGEEHGLKLQLGKGEKKEKFEKKSSSECVCLSQTGLTGLRDRYDWSNIYVLWNCNNSYLNFIRGLEDL